MSGAHYPDCLLSMSAWDQAPFTANELADQCECLSKAAAHIERIEALNRELVEAAADGLHEIDAAIRCVTDEATKAEMQAVADRLRAALKANLPASDMGVDNG